MIEDPPLLRVCHAKDRPSDDLLAAFRNIPTGFVVDCMHGRGALGPAVKPLNDQRAHCVGTALTCHAGPADNLAVFGALYQCRPGDVLVVATDNFNHTAVIGDLLLGMTKNKGAVGFVSDGMVRDIDGLLAVDLPCFSKGVVANSPAKSGPGSVGYPVQLDDVQIATGDIIVTDRDGVVVVPQAQAAIVAAKLKDVQKLEAELDAAVKGGLSTPSWLEAMMQSDRVVYEEQEGTING